VYILPGIIEKPRLGRAARAWALASLMLAMTCSRVFALGEDLLYTGTAYTVPAGRTQLQLAYNTVFGAGVKVSGASLRFGATRNFDWKLGYGYLWNDRSGRPHPSSGGSSGTEEPRPQWPYPPSMRRIGARLTGHASRIPALS
jgi:hypothetical protein